MVKIFFSSFAVAFVGGALLLIAYEAISVFVSVEVAGTVLGSVMHAAASF